MGTISKNLDRMQNTIDGNTDSVFVWGFFNEDLHWYDLELTIVNWIACISKILKCMIFFFLGLVCLVFFKHQVDAQFL